jgi:hypothetical protein
MRAARLLLLVLALPACATLALQEDGFHDKIPQGCASDEACQELQVEAEARVTKCKDNTVGYVRCDDARADLLVVRRKNEQWQTKRRAAQQREAEAEAQRKQEEREAEAARRREEKEKQEQAKAGEQARRAAFASWQDEQVARCTRTWSGAGCEGPPDGTSGDDKAACDKRCRAAADDAAIAAFDQAFTSCVQKVVETNGKGQASCDATISLAVTDPHPDVKARCDEQCAKRGQEQLQEARTNPPPKPVAGGRSGRGGQQPAESDGDQHVMCCDGTRSPTCVTRHRGCCSHHGGVCGG